MSVDTLQPESAERGHVSPSQLESSSRCPAAYARRYVDGDLIPPGIVAIRGTSVHAGAAENNRQKISSHEDLPMTQIVDITAEAFDASLSGGYTLTDDDLAKGSKNVIGRAKDDAVSLARLYATAVAPKYQPVIVEEKVRVFLPRADRDILGVIDLADDKQIVVDFKTGKKRTQADADTSIQLTFYAAAHHALLGMPARGVRIEGLHPGGKRSDPHSQTIDSDRTAADYQVLAHRTNALLKMIQTGSYPPAVPGAWWCAPKWCGYWSTCPFVNSERAAKAGGVTKVATARRQTKSVEPPSTGAIADIEPKVTKPIFGSPVERLLAIKDTCDCCSKPLTVNSARICRGEAGDTKKYLICRDCADTKQKLRSSR